MQGYIQKLAKIEVENSSLAQELQEERTLKDRMQIDNKKQMQDLEEFHQGKLSERIE